MSKKKVVKYPELDLQSGVLLRISRSGEQHAVFFDPNNDYASLLEGLLYLCANYIPELNIKNHCEESDILYAYVKDWLNQHDQGSLNIIKNEY